MKPLLPLILFASGLSMQAAEPAELKMWRVVPGRMQPSSKETENFIRALAGSAAVTGIAEPTLTIHRPKTPNGASVIVVPGGGYAFLSSMQQCTQACEWLNSLGITSVLLKYRTPTRDEVAPYDKPVQDALRAVAIIRDNAHAWKLDPKRVGLLGFGAGGTLLSHVLCDRAWQNQRPDFGIMIYGDAAADPTEPPPLGETFSVPADVPPVFMACTHGRERAFLALTALQAACAQQHVASQLHLFSERAVGFELRRPGASAAGWPQHCAQWLDDMGWLPSVAKVDAQIEQLEKKMKQELLPSLKKLMICGNNGLPELTEKIKGARSELLQAEQTDDTAQSSRTPPADCAGRAFARQRGSRGKRAFASVEPALERGRNNPRSH
ncbi:alpha/beta hydrolase [Prosthecobacter sp.]|uniref:alpha/beta hydrolase n=1 Tax=Prosthecobacter sp. TaxID=1965333 RepID=UPI0037837E40